MKQKLLIVLMALLLPMAASAYDACIDGIYYNIVKKAKQATVTYGENKNGTYSGKVVIPEKINYDGIICDVVGIGTSAFTNCKLSNLTLPQSLTKIDREAFGDFYNQKIEIDALCITDLTSWCNIEFIDEYSNPIRYASALFVNNEQVSDLVIPNGITSVKNYAFYSAKMLISVKLSDSVEAIGTMAFYFCSGLKSVTWGKGVASVGQKAFHGCKNIERVNISDLKAWLSVDFGISCQSGSLGEGNYSYIQNPLYYAGHLYLNGSELTDVVVPDGIETLWAHAFEGYTAITSLVIPDGVKEFKSRGAADRAMLTSGFSGLSDCPNLKSIKIGAGLEKMQISDCAALTSVEVGDSKITIEFSKCPLLNESGIKIYNAQEVYIRWCHGITELTLANIANATKFRVWSCDGLKKLQIPDGVSSVSVSDCPELTTIILGLGIEDNINGLGVGGCKELTDVYNPMTTPLKKASFGDDCQIEFATLHVPESTLNVYKATLPWSKFGTIVALKEGDPGYANNPPVDGFITFADSRVGKICVDNWDTDGDGKLTGQEAAAVKNLGTVFKSNTQITTFNELKYFTGVTSIGESAFNGCSKLTSIILPVGVTSIGESAFNGCSELTSIILPIGVTSICDLAFRACTSLNEITLPSTLTSIGKSAFSGCDGLTEIVIPDNVKELGEYAFFNCHKLASLTLSKGLTKIANNAFVNCPALMRIDIPEGIVEIGDYAFGKDDWYRGEISREQVTIPNSVKKVGMSIFSGTTVKKLFLGTGITEIEAPNNYWGTFEEIHISNLTDWLNLPLCVISNSPFRLYVNDSELKNLTIPEGMKEIVDFRFYNCISIIDLNIPSSVTSIGVQAFKGCTGLVSLEFSERITIGRLAFSDCTGITSILLPKNEKDSDIGFSAFKGCSGLKDVFCPITTPISIQETESTTPFPIGIATLHVPAESVDSYKKAIGWRKFANIVALQEGDPGYEKPKDGVTLMATSYCRVYGNANPTFEYTIVDGTITSGTPTITCSATITSPVGTYDIVIAKGTVSNSMVNLVNGTLTITKTPLTITAKSYTIKQGDALPTFEATYSGFKNNETSSVLTAQPVFSCSVTSSSVPGTYDIIVKDAAADNYEISYAKGTLTITPGIYKLTYLVDGAEYKSYQIEYGATITPEAAPTKEGYTFSGWSEIPSTMPAKDVTVTGTFAVNKYKLTYMVDGNVYKTVSYDYGATITPEAEPTKEGNTFSGWSNIPATMPAQDVTVTGTFTKGAYKLIYMVDGEVYKTISYDYGATITPEAEPTKEGYTFSGWSEIPSTMPAQDVTVTGTFTINKYMLVYMVDGIEYKSYEVEYGATITPETEPTKEGYTFSGWSNIPATMPAQDVTVTGTFTKGAYKLIYMVDGELYKTISYDYGATITPEAEPTKEGYTFSGWSEIPSTMPAQDVTVTGTFTINKYMLVYMVDGIEYKSYEVEYGATITPEAEPTKEGHTFSGWSNIPATMPAQDVTVTGTFTKAVYKLIYMVDGELYKTISYEYGATITPEAEPTKEGYTFSGWSEIPSTMPAQDVTVTGTFTINKYMLVYMVDGIEYKSYEVEYGATITPETEPTKEGYTFSGWSNIPATMPAQDVTVTGTFTQVVFTIDKVTYEITDEGTVIIKGSDQRGEVIIEVTIKINGQTYQVTAIADNAFKKNENITSLTIPAGITTIGDNAFEGCSGLFVINIGKDVQSIGNKAFANVGTATGTRTRNEESTIVVNCYTESVPQTAWNAFENTPIETGMLFVDDNLKDAFKSTSPWSRFGKIIGFEEAVGIKSISIDTDNARIYDMQGNRLDNVRKGMNIIRTEDGKIKKVMVK